jgi:hypothetical protein
MTEEVTELTSTGAAEELAGNGAPSTDTTANDTVSSGEPRDGAENIELLQQNTADPHRLLERGVALHVVSADEDEDTDRNFRSKYKKKIGTIRCQKEQKKKYSFNEKLPRQISYT